MKSPACLLSIFIIKNWSRGTRKAILSDIASIGNIHIALALPVKTAFLMPQSFFNSRNRKRAYRAFDPAIKRLVTDPDRKKIARPGQGLKRVHDFRRGAKTHILALPGSRGALARASGGPVQLDQES